MGDRLTFYLEPNGLRTLKITIRDVYSKLNRRFVTFPNCQVFFCHESIVISIFSYFFDFFSRLQVLTHGFHPGKIARYTRIGGVLVSAAGVPEINPHSQLTFLVDGCSYRSNSRRHRVNSLRDHFWITSNKSKDNTNPGTASNSPGCNPWSTGKSTGNNQSMDLCAEKIFS